jgi:hypothetical protein
MKKLNDLLQKNHGKWEVGTIIPTAGISQKRLVSSLVSCPILDIVSCVLYGMVLYQYCTYHHGMLPSRANVLVNHGDAAERATALQAIVLWMIKYINTECIEGTTLKQETTHSTLAQHQAAGEVTFSSWSSSKIEFLYRNYFNGAADLRISVIEDATTPAVVKMPKTSKVPFI